MKMILRMEELELSPQELAERLGYREEVVHKMLKGKENLNLGNIAKIEKAIGLQFIDLQSNRPNTLLVPND